MVCLGFEPWTTGWLGHTYPLSYGGPNDLKRNKKSLLLNDHGHLVVDNIMIKIN